MADFATPNLPARDFAITERFYARLGFERVFRADFWMILARGAVWLEFFPFPELVPAESSFSCCLRLDDLDAMVGQIRAAGIVEGKTGHPRFMQPRREASGMTIAYLNDPDNSLLRLVQNREEG